MEEMTFPIERTPAMKVLGTLWTGSVSGQILVGVLLIIGVAFMGTQDFNIVSIIFFFAFVVPMAYILHVRLVSKGKKLMEPWCDLQFDTDDKILMYKSGFPNTMDIDWQRVSINEKNKNIIIKGNTTGGYHLRLSGKQEEPIRLGLWIDLDDARDAANKLNKWLKGEIILEIKEETVDDN